MARGQETSPSDVDLRAVGEVSFSEIAPALSETDAKLGREVTPTVYKPGDFMKNPQPETTFFQPSDADSLRVPTTS
jgi:hypothetical protein